MKIITILLLVILISACGDKAELEVYHRLNYITDNPHTMEVEREELIILELREVNKNLKTICEKLR